MAVGSRRCHSPTTASESPFWCTKSTPYLFRGSSVGISRRFHERGSRTYLIVSRIDGSERHTIGAVEGESYRLYDLRWLPGDRYLSFLYNDELWKVPSEGFTVE